MKDFDVSGAWRSVYHYTSTSTSGEFTSEHDVEILTVGNQVVMQSKPNESGSYILLRFSRDERILTGTWYEQTSPTGDYKGVTYYGAIQLILDEDGQTFRGKYVGFNRHMLVQSGDWKITRI